MLLGVLFIFSPSISFGNVSKLDTAGGGGQVVCGEIPVSLLKPRGSLLGFIATEILTAVPPGQGLVVHKYHYTYDRTSFLRVRMSGSEELCVT